MTNRLAVVLALLVIVLVIFDVWVFDSEHLVFLGKKLADLIDWMKFWR